MPPVRTLDELNAIIDDIDPIAYSRTRNNLDGAVTRLSPYITRGVITLPHIRERLLQRHNAFACEKLLQELAWREYFQRVWWEKGDAIFSDLRFPRDDWRHHELVTALVEGKTGISAIDAAVAELFKTGYMHNHMRMWVAALATNLARADWHDMGKWLYYHLADGDLASNFLSWQWVAGTSVNKQYTTSQSLINACGGGTERGTWLDIERDDLLTMVIPDVLKPQQPFAYTTTYPESTVHSIAHGETVCLYTPWTLNPAWRREQSSRRILVIDPTWFDAYPVSEAVMDFILAQGAAVIDGLEVWVGEPATLPGFTNAAAVYAVSHPTNQDWAVSFDESAWLHPHVTRYYPSFFAYWQAVTKRA